MLEMEKVVLYKRLCEVSAVGEDRVSELKDKLKEELEQSKKDKDKVIRYHWEFQDIWDTMKGPNLGIEPFCAFFPKDIKVITENFPELGKEMLIQI